MSLGVLNNISAIYAQNNLDNTQASLQKVLEQLSSGSRINSGADDAAGLSISNGLAANSAALTQSSANATTGVGLLQVADGALSQVNSLLNRAITLATEAGNGTLNASQNAAAQQEYGDILSEINTIGSSTVFNGNAVFSSGTENIFTSDGTTTGTTNYSVGVGTLNTSTGIGVTAPGVTLSSGGLSTLPLQTKAFAASQAYVAAKADSYTLTVTGGSNSDNIVNSATNPFAIQVGSTTYNLGVPTAGESLTALSTQIGSLLGSNVASVSVSAGAITITGLTGAANAVTLINPNSLYDTTLGGGTTGAAVVASQTSSSANAIAYSPAQTQTFQINAVSANDTFTNNGLTLTFNGANTAVKFTGAGGVDTQAQLIKDIGTALAASGAGATAGVAAGTGSTAPSTADIIIQAGSVTSTSQTFTLSGSVNDILTPVAGSAATAGVALAGTNLNTNASAASALTSIYAAINDISYQRGAVGANINTLTAVSNVESTQNVNVASAQNSISATDYGQATSNLSKYEILSQTGISALAQANSVQQEVLKLLQ